MKVATTLHLILSSVLLLTQALYTLVMQMVVTQDSHLPLMTHNNDQKFNNSKTFCIHFINFHICPPSLGVIGVLRRTDIGSCSILFGIIAYAYHPCQVNNLVDIRRNATNRPEDTSCNNTNNCTKYHNHHWLKN